MIKMKFIINSSNISYYFEQVLVTYISTYLIFCTYLLISNKKKSKMLCSKTKPTALIIWSHENFKLKGMVYKWDQDLGTRDLGTWDLGSP